jgi:hypothetical protein
MTTKETDTPWTMSVPAAGKKYFGLARNASYRAAAKGDIPTVEVGGLIKALPRVIEAMLSKEKRWGDGPR